MKIINFTYSGFSLEENGVRCAAPAWVNFLLSVGGLSRIKSPNVGENIVTILILPTRSFASGFAALGAMLNGAMTFEDKLSWNKFRGLAINSEVYFKEPTSQSRYAGNIIEFTKIGEDEFISLKVLRPANVAKKGLTYLVSRNNFDQYSFSTEQPLSQIRENIMDEVANLYKNWIVDLNPKWLGSDGAECLIVGTLSNLTSRFKEVFITSDEISSISLEDILCMQNINESRHGKVRFTHSRGNFEGDFPLRILDGLDAFNILSQGGIDSNILILLERSEYHENVHNTLLQLKQSARDITESILEDIQNPVPAGVELMSFAVS